MISYEAHRAWLIRQLNGARAELHGYEHAILGPMLRRSKDAEEQARFEQGYRDGQAKMMQDSLRTGDQL